MLNVISKKIGPKVGTFVLKGKKIAPDVAIVGGLGLVALGGIWLGERIRKGAKDLDDAKMKIDEIKEKVEDGEITREESKQSLSEARKEYAIKITKTYGAPIAMIVAGSFSVLTGHREIKIRNRSLVTALGIEAAKKAKLVKKIDEEHGEGTASKWMNDVYEEFVEVEDKKGKKKKKAVEQMHDLPSGFATFLDATSGKWSKDPSLTKMAVKNAERYLNDELETGRFVSGYEFFMAIDLKPEVIFNKNKVDALKRMGWMKKDKNDPIYISYHIFDVHKEHNERFIQGYDNVPIIEPIGMSWVYDL